MTKILTALSKSLSFAHLAGLAPRASDETDDKKDTRAKSAKAADEDGDEDGDGKPKDDDSGKGKAKSKATDDDDGDPKNDDDGDADKKAKKAKAANADDDSDADAEKDDPDEEMRGNSAAAAARQRERARCAAIFASPAAARNVALAAHFAFKTSMSRSEAIAALAEAPASGQARAANPARGASNPHVTPSGGAPAPRSAAVAKSLDAAFASVNRGKKR